MSNQTNEKKDKSKKEGFLDIIANHPNASSLLISLSATGHTIIPRLLEASKYNMLDDYVSENWPYFIAQTAFQYIIVRGALASLQKFERPKVKNFMKSLVLEIQLHKKRSEDECDDMYFHKLNEFRSCFAENSPDYHLILAGVKYQRNNFSEGIDELLVYLRNRDKKKQILESLSPPVLATSFLYAIKQSIQFFGRRVLFGQLGNLNYEHEREKIYSAISSSLLDITRKWQTKMLLEDLNTNFWNLEDKLTYGNVMTYLDGPKQKHWEPFFLSLENKLDGEELTISDIVDRSADTRNKVLKYRNIFLKEYESESDLENELNNLKVFSNLDHVVSRATIAEFDDKKYLLTPFSGTTLIEALENLSKEEADSAYEMAIDNLLEIHSIGTKKLKNIAVNSTHYTERVRELTKSFLQFDERELAAYNDVISKRFAIDDCCYYKDNNLRNVLYDSGVVREIDFEKNLLKPPTFDIISTMEFADGYNPELVAEMIHKYHTDFKRFLKLDFQEFKELYEFSRVQRHLELAGYRSRDGINKDSVPRIAFHLDNTLDALSNLKSLETNIDFVTRIESKINESKKSFENY